ncbi:MAG: HEAT repeat domain-containing protein [Candidatus Scalinduaceae bacterium]
MSIRCLALIIGIVLMIFTPSAIATEEEVNVGEKIKEAITIFIGGTSRERVEAAGVLAKFKTEDLIAYDAWVPFTKVLKEDDSPHVQQAVVNALGVQGSDASEFDKLKIIDLIVKTIKNENMNSVVRAKAIVVIGPLMSKDTGAKYKGSTWGHGGVKTEKRKKIVTDPLMQRDFSERGAVGYYLEKQLDANDTILTKAIMETLNLWNWDLSTRIWKDVVTNDLYIRRPAIKSIKNQIIQSNLKIGSVKARDLLHIIDSDQRNKDLRIDLINLLTFAVKSGSKIPTLANTLERIIKSNSDRQVTFAAVGAIGRTGNPNLMGLLLKVFDKYKDNEEAEMIRSAACASAGEFIVLPGKHEEYFVRYRGNFEKLSEKLVETLMKDNSKLVRKEAAYALGNMTSEKYDRRKTVAALIEVAIDPDESVAKTVLDSLKFITIQDFGKDIEAWRRWYQANQHDFIAK